MTEDDAKTKWCPMTAGISNVFRRDDSFGSNLKCIGSACMAWRVMGVWNVDEKADEEIGYCGLAGEP